MTLEELRKEEKDAYSRWMYYEAAERGYDHKAAQRACDDYLAAKSKREAVEAKGGAA